MAFVARAERVLALGNGLLPRTPDAVGPGVYSTQNQDMGNSSKKRVNFVPFSSSSVRRVDATADLDIYSPGPGEYIQHSFLDDARKKSTCVSVFHSTTQRSEVPVSDVPGAGTYDLQHDWNKKNAHRTQLFVHRLSQHMQPFPVSTVPSIPVQEQACGYEETRDGRLVLQKRSRIRHVGVNEDKVGPGEYDTDQGADLVAHSNVGTAWSKFKQKRSTLVPKARSFLPGPGTYDPEILQRPKTQGKWPSSSFKSTTPRAAPNADYGERLSSPGPGAYSPGELQRPRTNPPSFGTTSDRLVPLSGAEILNTPGPGTYGVVETFQNPRRIHTADAAVGFGSATLRCVEPKMSPNLGPGAYDTEMDVSALHYNYNILISFVRPYWWTLTATLYIALFLRALTICFLFAPDLRWPTACFFPISAASPHLAARQRGLNRSKRSIRPPPPASNPCEKVVYPSGEHAQINRTAYLSPTRSAYRRN